MFPAPIPRFRTDALIDGAILALLVAIAGKIARGGVAIVALPTLNGAESWALETVAAFGLSAWYAASLAEVRAARAANDNRALGYGGSISPIAD